MCMLSWVPPCNNLLPIAPHVEGSYCIYDLQGHLERSADVTASCRLVPVQIEVLNGLKGYITVCNGKYKVIQYALLTLQCICTIFSLLNFIKHFFRINVLGVF